MGPAQPGLCKSMGKLFMQQERWQTPGQDSAGPAGVWVKPWHQPWQPKCGEHTPMANSSHPPEGFYPFSV